MDKLDGIRPAKAGEPWNVWTENGPMISIRVTMEEIVNSLNQLHQHHEYAARRSNEMLSALRGRLREFVEQNTTAVKAEGAPPNPGLQQASVVRPGEYRF